MLFALSLYFIHTKNPVVRWSFLEFKKKSEKSTFDLFNRDKSDNLTFNSLY